MLMVQVHYCLENLISMKKCLQKDKNNRKTIQKFEKNRFILKSVIKNLYYLHIIQWMAVLILSALLKRSSGISLINKCVLTASKKRIYKFCIYSRIAFIKVIKKKYRKKR